jgi:hypothetical protein
MMKIKNCFSELLRCVAQREFERFVYDSYKTEMKLIDDEKINFCLSHFTNFDEVLKYDDKALFIQNLNMKPLENENFVIVQDGSFFITDNNKLKCVGKMEGGKTLTKTISRSTLTKKAKKQVDFGRIYQRTEDEYYSVLKKYCMEGKEGNFFIPKEKLVCFNFHSHYFYENHFKTFKDYVRYLVQQIQNGKTKKDFEYEEIKHDVIPCHYFPKDGDELKKKTGVGFHLNENKYYGGGYGMTIDLTKYLYYNNKQHRFDGNRTEEINMYYLVSSILIDEFNSTELN